MPCFGLHPNIRRNLFTVQLGFLVFDRRPSILARLGKHFHRLGGHAVVRFRFERISAHEVRGFVKNPNTKYNQSANTTSWYQKILIFHIFQMDIRSAPTRDVTDCELPRGTTPLLEKCCFIWTGVTWDDVTWDDVIWAWCYWEQRTEMCC